MTEEESSTFRTKRRSIGSDGELKWGGDDGEQWSEAVESSEGVTVTDDGMITSGSDIPNGEIEDFEWGGPLSDRYIGDTAPFEIQNDSSLEGSWLLNCDGGNFHYIVPDDSADYYEPEPGDPVFGADMMMGDDYNWPYILFGMNDKGQGYGLAMTSGGWSLRTIDGNTHPDEIIASSDTDTSQNVRYFHGVEWGTDGTITAKIYEYSNGSYSHVEDFGTTDTRYTNGKIGFFRAGGRDNFESYYDYFRFPDFI